MNTTQPAANSEPRNLPNTTAKPLPATAKQLRETARAMMLEARKAEAIEKANKPARRSKDSGNTFVIKSAVGRDPKLSGEKLAAALRGKLTANQHGMLPTQSTLDTIRGDFLHAMRVAAKLGHLTNDARKHYGIDG